jgi:hypothetical protein
VRELLDDEPVKVQTLLVAMPGAPQQFVQQLTKTWAPVGTLVTSDQAIVRLLFGPNEAPEAQLEANLLCF